MSPILSLSHTHRIDAMTVDQKINNYIATCCANGTVTVWSRQSESQIGAGSNFRIQIFTMQKSCELIE